MQFTILTLPPSMPVDASPCAMGWPWGEAPRGWPHSYCSPMPNHSRMHAPASTAHCHRTLFHSGCGRYQYGSCVHTTCKSHKTPMPPCPSHTPPHPTPPTLIPRHYHAHRPGRPLPPALPAAVRPYRIRLRQIIHQHPIRPHLHAPKRPMPPPLLPLPPHPALPP